MAVIVGVEVGGSGVFVGVADGSWPIGVGVGLNHAGCDVCVGKTTGAEVTVGLNTAVIVKSGVGKTIGVGEEIKGKLQASIARNNKLTTTNGNRQILIIFSSQSQILHANFNIIEHLASRL